ncbi:MAG: glycoside hydrolase [Actinomycetota bacterium]|nr:glycoside hydrolase [Actinomycetota bacterium]
MRTTRTRPRRAIIVAAVIAVGSVAVLGFSGSSSTAASAATAEPVTGRGRMSPNSSLGDAAPGLGRDVPGLAVDPANPDHVVEVDEDFGRGQCTFRTTVDGGRTWMTGDLAVPPGLTPTGEAAVPPCDSVSSGGHAHFDQSVAFGTAGNVYTTFSVANAVIVARSSDGGTSWSPGVVAVGPPPVSGAVDIRPQLAVEPRPEGDRLYVSALGPSGPLSGPGLGPSGTGLEAGGAVRLVTTRSDDGGSTWSPLVDAQGDGDQVREPAQPAVGPDGAVYVAWHSSAGPTADRVVVARSGDGGATWARTVAGESTGDSFPYLVVDGRGAVDLVYGAVAAERSDIYFQQSSIGGSTWSKPARVSDDRSASRPVEHLVPRLAVASGGRIDVAWLDTRSAYDSPADAPLGFGDIWYSSSTDDGKAFSTNRRVNDRSINLGPGAASQSALARHGPVLAERGADQIMFAWGDSRNAGVGTGVDSDSHAGSDVFTATLDLGPTGVAPAITLDDSAPEKLSVDLSRLAFPGATAKAGSQRTTRIVLVNGTDDTGLALAAAVLARANESPLLLARATDLTSEQKKEVARLAPGGAYLVGAATRLSDKVASSLADAGATDVQRITGSDSTETAGRIAALMDTRDADQRANRTPAFDGAVIVNSQTGDAATGTALAAALRMPVLFTQRDTIAPATTKALDDLNITSTIVVGGPESVAKTVLDGLPGARRLGGDDPTATSAAVAAEARARNVAVNVVYVSDGERPNDQAAIGAAVASLGGLMLAEPDASPAAARHTIDGLGLTPIVDRLVSIRSNTAGAGTGIRIALATLILLIGIATIVVALVHRAEQQPDSP